MAKHIDTPTDAEARRIQQEIHNLSQRIVRFVQDAADDDAVLASAGCADAAAYLLASLKPNDKLRDEFLAGVRDSFDKYADAMAMRDLDHN